MPTHLAALLTTSGQPFAITPRPTPTPSPHEVLIRTHAIAVNPIDIKQRDVGFPPVRYPSVIGSDISGIIVSAGASTTFQPGDRVLAFAPTYYTRGDPDYGAFQEVVRVNAATVVRVPDGLGDAAAASVPMSVVTAWSGLSTAGLVPQDCVMGETGRGQGMLVWGGSSSVGCAMVQIAAQLGFAVYATASVRNAELVKGLGARTVFDYKDPEVVDSIVAQARADGRPIRIAFDAGGAMRSCLDVLKAFNDNGGAKLATAVHVGDDGPKEEGIETKFVLAPTDEGEREAQYRWVFHEWLGKAMESGAYVPSPPVRVVGKGIESLNKAVDELKAGVSATKIVVEV